MQQGKDCNFIVAKYLLILCFIFAPLYLMHWRQGFQDLQTFRKPVPFVVSKSFYTQIANHFLLYETKRIYK